MPSASDTGNPNTSDTNGAQNPLDSGSPSTDLPTKKPTGKLGLRSLKVQSSNGASGTTSSNGLKPETEPSGNSIAEESVSLASLIPDLASADNGASQEPISLASLIPDFEPSSGPGDTDAPISLAGLIPDLEASPVTPAETAPRPVTPVVETPVEVAQEVSKPVETVTLNVATPVAPVAEVAAPEAKPQPPAQAVPSAPPETTKPVAQPVTPKLTPAAPAVAAQEVESTALAPSPGADELEKAGKKANKKASKKLKKAIDSDYDRVKLDYQFHRIVQQLEVLPSMESPLLIGVTSTLRGEGRTTIAMGLASAISQEIPLPVVLLETDLTNPSLAEDLNLPNRGLSEYLRGELELDDLTQSTALPDMAVIVAGDCKGQALRILRSERLSSLITILSQQFAAVVVDLPPMSMTGEAARVISQLDRVLMVVEAGSTPNKLVKTALELIPEEKKAGVLLNRTRPAFGFFQWVKRLFR